MCGIAHAFYINDRMMRTYKQLTKEESRRLVWQNAVRSLTQNRTSSRVIDPNYMDHLWEFCKGEVAHVPEILSLDNTTYEKWKRFAEIQKGVKQACDLKVAFFCGPEPENDVEHLLELGVRIENIYAFEYDKDIFRVAVNSLQDTYPSLKIFNGKIETYVSLHQTKFDIIYLDFTGTMLTEFKVVAQILDSNALTDLGVLIVNTTYPDKTEDNVRFLAEYFIFRTFFEHSAISTVDEDEEWNFVESCSAYGIYDVGALIPLIRDHFEDAYSAFQTNFIATYSNLIKPIYAIVNNPILRKRLFATDATFREILDDKERFSDVEEDQAYDQPLLYSAFSMITENHMWNQFLCSKEQGMQYTRLEAIKVLELFLYANYEEYLDLLSPRLQEELPAIKKTIIENACRERGLFCDVPMIHLWLELMVMQIGYTYHHNTHTHKRYTYTAKTRPMCLDIFTMDTCREVYDSLPMMEYFSYDMMDESRQIVIRMCMDAISSQNHWQLDQLYYGAHLVGLGDYPWCEFKGLPRRIVIAKKAQRIQTVEDLFADGNKVVYHYFPASEKDSILREGLLCSKSKSSRNSEKQGIYVVWSDDIRVRNAIVETQVRVDFFGNPVAEICQLSINLKKYGITVQDIAPDLNGEPKCDINSFSCKIMKDISNIEPADISDWEGGSADTYGIEFYNLEGYNIDYKPTDYESGLANGWYPDIIWKEYA